MKKLLIASILYIFTTIPALADAPPALLGELETGHIQKIENAEDVRGKWFSSYSSFRKWCASLSRSRCIGAVATFDSRGNINGWRAQYQTRKWWGGWSSVRHRAY